MANTFYKFAVNSAPQQIKIIDTINEEAPIVSEIPVLPTSSGMQHSYQKITATTGPGLVELDGALTTISADTKLETINLSIFGGVMKKGVDTVAILGGKSKAFANELMIASKSFAQELEKSVLYNSLRTYSINNGNYIKAGGSASVNRSIICVTWSEGEINGLYNPEFYGAGKVLDVIDLTPSAPVLNQNTSALEWQYAVKGNFGMQLANESLVSSIVNIDTTNAPNLFLASMIDEVIVNARARGKNSMLIMHPTMASYLSTFKTTQYYSVLDSEINRLVAFWNGVRIVESYNMLNKTETTVS